MGNACGSGSSVKVADSTKNVGKVQNTPDDTQVDQNQNQHQISSSNIQPASSSNESATSILHETVGGAAQVANGVLARPQSGLNIAVQTHTSSMLDNLQAPSHDDIDFSRQMMTVMCQDQQQRNHKESSPEDPEPNLELWVENVIDKEIVSSRENSQQRDNLDEVQRIMDQEPKVTSNLDNDQVVELVYFDKQRLTAEPARLIMQYANMPYREELVPMDEWLSYKSGTPMGTLPVLRLAEGDLCQPMAIARYLASTHGLLGVDDWEAANVDMLMYGFLDLLDNLKPMYSEPDDGIRGDLWRQSKDDIVTSFLEVCSTALGEKKFFVGSQLTLADLAIADFLNTLRLYWDPALLDDHSNLKLHVMNTLSIPSIENYILGRPTAHI